MLLCVFFFRRVIGDCFVIVLELWAIGFDFRGVASGFWALGWSFGSQLTTFGYLHWTFRYTMGLLGGWTGLLGTLMGGRPVAWDFGMLKGTFWPIAWDFWPVAWDV